VAAAAAAGILILAGIGTLTGCDVLPGADPEDPLAPVTRTAAPDAAVDRWERNARLQQNAFKRRAQQFEPTLHSPRLPNVGIETCKRMFPIDTDDQLVEFIFSGGSKHSTRN
jgi:hypothetical protein